MPDLRQATSKECRSPGPLLHTGDIHPQICLRPGTKVIVDEFHFIFNDPDRTRAYIDGLRSTSFDSDLLIMSATFGNPDVIKRYLQDVAMREFVLYTTERRVTDLIFRRKGIRFSKIHDALVFVFSKKAPNGLPHRYPDTAKRLAGTKGQTEGDCRDP